MAASRTTQMLKNAMTTREQFINNTPNWKLTFLRLVYNSSYFPSLGLWRDDVRKETPDVKEALALLPQEVIEDRNFRIARALLLSSKKIQLPREEWTKFEEDYLYLDPFVKYVKEMKQEQTYWNRQ